MKLFFSGEWSFGGVNMLRVLANVYNDDKWTKEANWMRTKIQEQLVKSEKIPVEDEGVQIEVDVTGVKYSNKRHFIPFGWWANPILSTASTGWAVLLDSAYNPWVLGGKYTANYPL